MAGFTESLRLNIARLKKEVDTKLYSVYVQLGSEVIARCPVLRGNLINDFWPASNEYNYTVKTRIDTDGNSQIGPNTDKTGSGSVSRLRDVKDMGTFLGKDGFLSFSTSVPYAYRIEYEGWSSRKAPAGFIRLALTAVAAKNR